VGSALSLDVNQLEGLAQPAPQHSSDGRKHGQPNSKNPMRQETSFLEPAVLSNMAF
jgi:hypothetical protein